MVSSLSDWYFFLQNKSLYLEQLIPPSLAPWLLHSDVSWEKSLPFLGGNFSPWSKTSLKLDLLLMPVWCRSVSPFFWLSRLCEENGMVWFRKGCSLRGLHYVSVSLWGVLFQYYILFCKNTIVILLLIIK